MTVTFHQACYGSVTSLTSAQADHVYIMSSGSSEEQIGPVFDLSTSAAGCALDVTAYIWDDTNLVWTEYDNAFDFYAACTSCSGQIKVQKPADITSYKPFKDYIVKLVATDESGFGNTVESQFNLQLRDFCADGEISL